MSSGDFAAELEQSVKQHREAIASMVAQAKARIEQGVAAVRPTDQDAAFASATAGNEPAVRFDDLPGADVPVWEDPL
jgi:hypothetical protein